jgi:beta-lactamase class A
MVAPFRIVTVRRFMLRTFMLRKEFALLAIVISTCLSFLPSAAGQIPPTSEKQEVLWMKLEKSILDVDRSLDGVMGVSIIDLVDGHKYLLHANDVYPQASSIKICVLAELYRQAQQGKLKLTDMYTVNAADLVQDSDNSATNVLIDRVGIENVNAFLSAQGLRDTRLRRKMMDLKAAGEGRENISTPNEMSKLLQSLYQGKILNKEMTDDFFKVLATHKDSWIPRNLPDDLKIADKPGALEGVRNDSGVIFVDKRPYILCVMTTYLRRERDGEEAISNISLAAWRMFDRMARASEYGRVISPGNSSR